MATADDSYTHPRAHEALGRGRTLLIWHGYLLGGTGSNIYTTNIAASWVRAGHHVIVMCQDRPRPEAHPWAHEFHRVRGAEIVERVEITPGGVAARQAAGEGSCLVVQADIGGLLPVYVLDRYEGFEVKRFDDCSDAELESWARHYRAAINGLAERHTIDGALLNHAVMGPPMLRITLDTLNIPYTVKVHGSELEYCIAEHPERFAQPALEGLQGARSILVGSAHIAARTLELVAGDDAAVRTELEAKMAEVPPGVDLEHFRPTTDRAATYAQLVDALAARASGTRGRSIADALKLRSVLAGGNDTLEGTCATVASLHERYDERAVDAHVVSEIASLALDSGDTPTVCYVGKFIRQKGVHLLLAALPLVREDVPEVGVVIVGFGPMREGLEALVTALDEGDVELLSELAHRGASLDGGEDGPLPELVDLLAELEASGRMDEYLESARGMRDRVAFTGLVDHEVLASLWPLCRTSVVPSILPEAFGMVSAEAAACGCIPIVADHSGLGTVAAALRERLPEDQRDLVAFPPKAEQVVYELAARITRACLLEDPALTEVTDAVRRTVVEEWSWDALSLRVADSLAGTV